MCTNSKCSPVDKLEINKFYEIIVNSKCEHFNLVLAWPTGKLQVILDKTRPGYELSWVRVVLGTSCPGYESSWVWVFLGTSCLGYESSWVRVVLGTSCLGCELSWVRVVHNPLCSQNVNTSGAWCLFMHCSIFGWITHVFEWSENLLTCKMLAVRKCCLYLTCLVRINIDVLDGADSTD